MGASTMVKYPVFVSDQGDLMIFEKDMESGYLEHQDILRNEYRFFDSEGYCLQASISQGVLTLHRAQFCMSELRQLLLNALQAVGQSVSSEMSTTDLQGRAMATYDTY
jgi:hypothetical protein